MAETAFVAMSEGLQVRLSDFRVFDAVTGKELFNCSDYTRSQLMDAVGVKRQQLGRYIALLNEAIPEEFNYVSRQGAFSRKQAIALIQVRCFYLLGYKKSHITQKLRSEGIKYAD